MTSEAGESIAPVDGLKQLLEGPKLALDKTPVLHAVFDRLASACADGVRDFSTARCAFALDGISGGNTGDLLKAYATGFGAVFHSPELDARIVIGCDRRFAYSMIEAMFGSDGSEAPIEIDRPLTALEGRIMQEILVKVAEALRQQLAPICNASFVVERTECTMDCSTTGLSDTPALIAHFIVQVLDGGGRIFVLIPNSALAPFRKHLERGRPVEPLNVDPSWSRQLQLGIGHAEVELKAVLEGPQLTLASLSRLCPGQILTLESTPNAPIELEAEDQTLFTAKLVQARGLFTVCIERRVDEREVLLSDILGGQG